MQLILNAHEGIFCKNVFDVWGCVLVYRYTEEITIVLLCLRTFV